MKLEIVVHISKEAVFLFELKKKIKYGSWIENKVAGFIVFSQWLLKDYFRLINVDDCPAGLEIGEKLL